MRLTVNKMSALRILRAVRNSGGRLGGRCDLLPPDISPRRRMSAAALPLDDLALPEPPSEEHPLYLAVPGRDHRVQASFASSTVYSTGLPPGSFTRVSDSVVIPCPELLYIEMAPLMSPTVHVLLGYELCGTYSRDAANPRTGDVTFGLRPATTTGRIGDFIARCHNVRGLDAARRSLELIENNAWSPMESIISTFAVLPATSLGYGLGDISLNVRHSNPPELVALGCRASRVPDIEVVGTCIGFNYDGIEHFNVGAIAQENDEPARARASHVLREKYVDDLRRNRELAGVGRIVLPVTTEDLFQEGGLDAVMLEAAGAIEALDGRDVEHVRSAVRSRTIRRARQRIIWSLLPWDAAEKWAREIVRRERPKAMQVIDVELTV